MSNTTTAIKKIVMQVLGQEEIGFFNDKRKDGTRRLKFPKWLSDATATIDTIKTELINANIVVREVYYLENKYGKSICVVY